MGYIIVSEIYYKNNKLCIESERKSVNVIMIFSIVYNHFKNIANNFHINYQGHID